MSKNIPPMIRIQDAKVGQAIKFYIPESIGSRQTEQFGIVSLIIASEDYDTVHVFFGYEDTYTEMPKNHMVHNLGRVSPEAVHHIHGTDISTNAGVTHV